MKTEMGKVMDQFKSNGGYRCLFTSQMKQFDKTVVKTLLQDGMIKDIHRGQGRPTLWELTAKGKTILELSK